MCFVLTCVFYRRIKSRCVWLNVKQCTQSFTGRHNMYTASRQSSSAYGCNRPKIIRKSHCVGLFKWNLVQRLAVARKRKWENPPDSDQSVWSEPLIICCDDIFWYGGWLGAVIGNYARYLEEINIREDKLLLYHCLLELGLPKVSVSEQ
jgi:hypothetical protein